MDYEFQEEKPEVVIEESNEASVGRLALWASDLPISAGTVRLMEDISIEIPEIAIREEQLECLEAIYSARLSKQEKALVQMATGLGKTTVVAADVKRFLDERPEARVLFLCHQNDILAQARERFEHVIGPDFSYGNFTGESQDYHEVTCLFASLQVMRQWREAFLETEFDYVVVDESHHVKAQTYEPTLRYFKPDFMLGITATPDRHDLKDIREIFGEEIYRLSLEEAIARGLLAQVDYRVITDEIVDASVLKDVRGARLNKKQLDRSIFIPKRDEEIARIIHEKATDMENPKRIVFCRSIEQAEEFAQYFADAAPLHSKLPKWEQDRYISQFKAGELSTLLTIDMFNEGIDIPDANQIVFLRSTQSKTIFLQQLGRGLRKTAGKDMVQVLDFVANCDRLAMLDEVWQDIQQYIAVRASDAERAMRIDIGNIQFTEVAREILDILAEIETRNALIGKWSAEDSVAYYLSLCSKVGRIATINDIERANANKEGPTKMVLLRHYNGRIVDLRTASGVEYVNSAAVSNEDIIQLALDIKPDGPLLSHEIAALSKKKQFVSISRIAQSFGSIPAFQRACGFEILDPDSISNEQIIALAKNLKAGAPLTAREIAEYSKTKEFVSPTLITSRFGSTTKFQQACGFDIVDPRSLTLEEVIARAVHIKPDSPLTRREIEALSEDRLFVSTKWIMDRFGSIPAFQRACGFNVRIKPESLKTHRMSNKDLVALALQLKPDAPLSDAEVKELSLSGKFASGVTLAKRFGSLPEFQRACGFDVPIRKFRVRRFTKEELVSEALRLKPDGPMTVKDISDFSNNNLFVSASTIAHRFGSIPAFQRACGFEQPDSGN